MTLTGDEKRDAIGVLRLGFAALMVPCWILGGAALVWVGQTLLGVGVIGIGLLMAGGAYRLYRAIERPDIVRDERTKEAQYRAGYNGFWTVILIPVLYISLSMFLPNALAVHLTEGVGFDVVYPISLLAGLVIYFGSRTYYRHYGF